MNVLKFGGTSVANAQNINLVLNIVEDAAKKESLVVTVSAFSGVTDLLVAAAAKAAEGLATSRLVEEAPPPVIGVYRLVSRLDRLKKSFQGGLIPPLASPSLDLASAEVVDLPPISGW